MRGSFGSPLWNRRFEIGLEARNKLAHFLNASSPNEIVFTRNATHSINQVAHGLTWEKGDVVLTSDREHNSNLVPWLQLEQEQGIDHRVVPSHPDNTFDMEAFEAACAEAGTNLKMVAMSHVGNLDGIEIPVAEVTKVARDYDALVAIDGAQSTPHMNVDVQALDIDFLSFSIHKMCGPSGMGGLWGATTCSTACEPSSPVAKPSKPPRTPMPRGRLHPLGSKEDSEISQA